MPFDVPPVITGQVPAIAAASAARGFPHPLITRELRGLARAVSSKVWVNSPARLVTCEAQYIRAHLTGVSCMVTKPRKFAVYATAGFPFVIFEDGSFRLLNTAGGSAARR